MIDPVVPADVDCTDLDSFMLNVEKLMASELVAISSNEVIGAALLLWARAWKQKPAASLPDDERVLAAFSRMSVPRFRKVRDEVLRGFVKCSDGRLYHRTLGPEAIRAYNHKQKFLGKREADAERLEKWRKKQREAKGETPNVTHSETHSETVGETRFVQEGRDDTVRDDTVRYGTVRTSKSTPNPFPATPSGPPAVRKARSEKPEKPEAPTAETWTRYAGAYERRYGVTPVRNATVNGQLANVVARLGAGEAPAVAEHFVSSNRGLYVSSRHSVSLLVRDCEAIRTEWATGRTMTDAEARSVDRTQTNFNAFAPLLEEARRREQEDAT